MLEMIERFFTYVDPIKAGWVASLVIIVVAKAIWDSLRGK